MNDDAIQVAIGASVSGNGHLEFYLHETGVTGSDLMSASDVVFAVAVLRDTADALEKWLQEQRH